MSGLTTPIGVALIGSGHFAREQHLPAILSSPTLSLRAIYSRSLASCTALSSNAPPDVQLYSKETSSDKRGYADLLRDPDIKAVVIALPILTQPGFIRQAFEAGKYILSEKPVGADTRAAEDVIQTTRAPGTGHWCVAENYRFLTAHTFARTAIKNMGHLLGFHVRMNNSVKAGSKYYETSWRKTPEYQGGFVLDGGVHFVAALRYLLGEGGERDEEGEANRLAMVSAFSTQLQPHLPPVDTVNATLRTQSGVSGTFAISFGTTFPREDNGFFFACERGTVSVTRGKVVIAEEGKEEVVKEFEGEESGVKAEVQAWAEGMAKGHSDWRLAPAEALRDLKVVEGMLRSGEDDGAAVQVIE